MLVWLIVLFTFDVRTNASQKNIAPEKLAREYKSIQNNMENFSEERQQLLNVMQNTSRRVRVIAQERQRLNTDIIAAQKLMKSYAREILDLEERLNVQARVVEHKVQILERIRHQGLWHALLAKRTGADLDNFVRNLQIFIANDADEINRYFQVKRQLVQKKEQMNKKAQQLIALQKNVQVQERKITGEYQKKRHVLSNMDSKYRGQLERMHELRALSRKKAKNEDAQAVEIEQIIEPSFYEQKARLALPTQGSITRKFGLFTDREYQLDFFSKGIFISTQKNAEVRAVFRGRVIYIGEIGHFGKTIVIDHHDHFYTLSAHLSNITVSMDTIVDEGDILGYSGADPIPNEYGLYFEIRHFTEAQDPSQWIKPDKSATIAAQSPQ